MAFTALTLEQIVNNPLVAYKKPLALFSAGLLFFSAASPLAFALPEGESVTNGSVSFERNGRELRVLQDSNKAIVNYNRFNIAQGESVRFEQPGSSSSILNRVTGIGSSTIAGNLSANGNVYLINRSGILFSSSAQVNVHGLVASSMELSNSDFLSGNLEFTGGGGTVVNQGSLSGDFIYLIGGSVQNNGSISARNIALAAGASSIKLDEAAGGEITLIIDGDTFKADASGQPVEAAEEVAEVSDASETDATVAATNTETTTEEEEADQETGTLIITSLDTGDVLNDGELNASGDTGGQIAVSGNRIAQLGVVEADGTNGDGGGISLLSRESLLVSSQSRSSANASGEIGSGGEIVFYTSGNARFEQDAAVNARGGAVSGNGGFVEFSGANHLDLKTVADVSSVDGQSGKVLLDPGDIDIIEGFFDDDDRTATGTAQARFANPVVFSPHSDVTEIFASTIIDQLDFGDVEVNTAGSLNGPNLGTITVYVPIHFENTVDRTLSLIADESIDFLLGSDVEPAHINAASLNLELTANTRIGLFNQTIDLNNGHLQVIADANGDLNGNVVIGSPSSTITAGDVLISGDDFHSVNLDIDAADVRIDQTGDINFNGNIQASGELALLADKDLIILGQSGETHTFHGENGVVFAADNDQTMTDGLLTTQNALAAVTTGGGPIFVSGHQVDLQDVTLQTPDASPNLIAVYGSDTVDLSLNDTNPNAAASHRADRFVAEAANQLRLGTPIVASGDALFESSNDEIVNDAPDLNGAPQVTADNAGFKARRGIGNSNGSIDVSVSSTLLVLSTDGEDINITERDSAFIGTGELDSGDLNAFVPALAGTIATPAVDLAFGVIEEPPVSRNPERPTEDDEVTTDTPDEMVEPIVPTTSPNTPPPPGIAPLTLSQILQNLPIVQQRRVDRGRSASVVENATARVRAVQFSDFYFLHEKMQISEYANDLDLYFIDYLIFGVAEITADPRIPYEVKGQIIHGGPRPYQL